MSCGGWVVAEKQCHLSGGFWVWGWLSKLDHGENSRKRRRVGPKQSAVKQQKRSRKDSRSSQSSCFSAADFRLLFSGCCFPAAVFRLVLGSLLRNSGVGGGGQNLILR